MKFLAFILSLFIFTVLALPSAVGKSDSETAEKACCSNHVKNDLDHQDQGQQEKDCCNNSCNPFVNCCGMMGFVVEKQLVFSEFTAQIQQANFDLYQSPLSQYRGDIWQPPKL